VLAEFEGAASNHSPLAYHEGNLGTGGSQLQSLPNMVPLWHPLAVGSS